MAPTLRASLCRILILIFANKIDLAHNFSVDFFHHLYASKRTKEFLMTVLEVLWVDTLHRVAEP